MNKSWRIDFGGRRMAIGEWVKAEGYGLMAIGFKPFAFKLSTLSL